MAEKYQLDSTLPSDQHLDSRDFRVVSVSIVASDGTVTELASSIAEVQVRQDMYLGFMSGELHFTDGNDTVARLGIHGGEYIYLHFTVPEQDIPIKKAFRIYKLGNRAPADSTQEFDIYFVSDELFISNTKKISKAYQNTTISNIVRDVLKNYLNIPDKKIFVSSTGAPTSVVIPNWRPSETLNWLASRAYTDKSTCYFFYESLEGFHFTSLQDIYAKPQTIKAAFSLQNKRGEKDLDVDKFSLDDYEVKKDFDILSTISSGGYAMSLLAVDPFSQSTNLYEYGLDGLNSMYKYPLMTNADDLFRKSSAHLMAQTKVDGIENWIKQVMSLSILNTSLTEVVMPGSLGLQAGTIINVNVPYTILPADGDMYDKRKSGKYLVIAVNHKFDIINHKFTSLVWLVRDSQAEPVPQYDKTLPKKIERLNS